MFVHLLHRNTDRFIFLKQASNICKTYNSWTRTRREKEDDTERFIVITMFSELMSLILYFKQLIQQYKSSFINYITTIIIIIIINFSLKGRFQWTLSIMSRPILFIGYLFWMVSFTACQLLLNNSIPMSVFCQSTDLEQHANALTQAESRLHRLQQAASNISYETECVCFN